MSNLPRPHAEAPEMRRPSAMAVAVLIEHVTRACHSASFSEGLNTAQWNGLRYLAAANPAACTVTAFARHNLTKKSTASETMSALIRKGLVVKRTNPQDVRSKLLEVTGKGRKMLQSDPLIAIADALDRLSNQDIDTVAAALERLLRALFRSPLGMPPAAAGEQEI